MMVTRSDEDLLRDFRQLGVPESALTRAQTHKDVPHSDKTDAVYTDTWDYTQSPPTHTSYTTHVHSDRSHYDHTDHGGVASAEIEPVVAQAKSGVADERLPPVLLKRFEALLVRMEDLLLSREEHLHQEVSLRLDAFMTEMTSAFSALQSRTADIDERLAAVEKERELEPV